MMAALQLILYAGFAIAAYTPSATGLMSKRSSAARQVAGRSNKLNKQNNRFMFISVTDVKFPSAGYYTAGENVKRRAILRPRFGGESELTRSEERRVGKECRSRWWALQ